MSLPQHPQCRSERNHRAHAPPARPVRHRRARPHPARPVPWSGRGSRPHQLGLPPELRDRPERGRQRRYGRRAQSQGDRGPPAVDPGRGQRRLPAAERRRVRYLSRPQRHLRGDYGLRRGRHHLDDHRGRGQYVHRLRPRHLAVPHHLVLGLRRRTARIVGRPGPLVPDSDRLRHHARVGGHPHPGPGHLPDLAQRLRQRGRRQLRLVPGQPVPQPEPRHQPTTERRCTRLHAGRLHRLGPGRAVPQQLRRRRQPRATRHRPPAHGRLPQGEPGPVRHRIPGGLRLLRRPEVLARLGQRAVRRAVPARPGGRGHQRLAHHGRPGRPRQAAADLQRPHPHERQRERLDHPGHLRSDVSARVDRGELLVHGRRDRRLRLVLLQPLGHRQTADYRLVRLPSPVCHEPLPRLHHHRHRHDGQRQTPQPGPELLHTRRPQEAHLPGRGPLRAGLPTPLSAVNTLNTYILTPGQ